MFLSLLSLDISNACLHKIIASLMNSFYMLKDICSHVGILRVWECEWKEGCIIVKKHELSLKPTSLKTSDSPIKLRFHVVIFHSLNCERRRLRRLWEGEKGRNVCIIRLVQLTVSPYMVVSNKQIYMYTIYRREAASCVRLHALFQLHYLPIIAEREISLCSSEHNKICYVICEIIITIVSFGKTANFALLIWPRTITESKFSI